AAGTGAYVIGAENGTFPPIGWHITGQMGGVWAPPTKLLDGLWFSVGSHWLADAVKYTTGPGFVRLSFPVTGGLRPTLTEFAPDGQPTVLFGLTLTPVSGKATTASVAADAHSQVAAAYPWGFTKPTFDSFNHQNTVSARGGVIQFRQESRPWYAEVGASPQPASVKTGTGFWGPTPATLPKLSGIDAAYPDYAEFFGTDGAYAIYSLVAAGQWQTAMQHLNTLRTVSQLVNGSTGKVVHEISSTGAVYFGDNTEPGDINETAQFDIAAGLVWQWSGDQAFLHQNYAFIKAGLQYLTSLEPGGKDDLWPD